VALDLTAQGLYDEVRKAIDHRDRYLGSAYDDCIARYVGPGYRRHHQGKVDFNNHAYKVLSTFLPLLASGNPRARTKTPRQGSAAAITKAVEFAVNRNAELQNLKKTVEELATDWFFKWCIAFTQPRPALGMIEREDPPYRPTTVRMSLLDYAWDPVAIKHAEARFQAHRIIRDSDSIERESREFPKRGWDRTALSKCAETPNRDHRGEKLMDSFDRNEIEYWEVWLPEVKLDVARDEAGRRFEPLAEQGFHGTIYTVAKDSPVFLRAPRPFWGPRDGPYTFSGYLPVPDRSIPLSMLAVTYAQAEVHNLVWEAAVMAIRKYKRGIAVGSGSAAELQEKLAEFEDLGIFTVEALDDVKKAIQEIEIAGLSQQHIQMLQMLGLNLEQLSGLTDAMMGQVSGQGTATEASIANMSSGRRLGYATEKFITQTIRPIFQKEAWYAVMHPLSRSPLGDQADKVFVDPMTGEPIEAPILLGGRKNAELLEDMDIEIDPASTRYTSELLEAERSAQQDQWLAMFAPMIPQTPWIEWGQVVARKAEQWGDPSWARVVNMNKANLIGAMQMQMDMSQIPPGPTQPQPRLGVDTQPRQALKSSESPAGFSRNARSQGGMRSQVNKAPRTAGASRETHAAPSKELK
jgi:hypothetical protein